MPILQRFEDCLGRHKGLEGRMKQFTKNALNYDEYYSRRKNDCHTLEKEVIEVRKKLDALEAKLKDATKEASNAHKEMAHIVTGINAKLKGLGATAMISAKEREEMLQGLKFASDQLQMDKQRFHL